MALEKTKSPVTEGELAVVIGAGASGEAAARLLTALGARVRLVEKDKSRLSEQFRLFLEDTKGEVFIGPHEASQFSDAALVVTSPGVPLKTLRPYLSEAAAMRKDKTAPRLIGELELALPFVDAPIIAITGTSGKTTTASLTAAMLRQAGKKVFLGGNIGTPLSAYVLSGEQGEQADVLVLECSSFQLQTSPSLHPSVAMLLNLTENHLDQHEGMEEYVNAKLSIFANQTETDLAVLPAELVPLFAGRDYRARAETFAPTMRFMETRLVGAHNASNAEAAFIAAREFGVSEATAAEAVAQFEPLRHRLEVVGTLDGVTFVNDSKSTTVEALRVALESFTTPVWLLAGGKFKGGDLASLKPLLAAKVKEVALYGASREIFEEAWKGSVPLTYHATMDQALAHVRKKAEAGEVALLSPATSSYDQFDNYLERGDHFCRLVREDR